MKENITKLLNQVKDQYCYDLRKNPGDANGKNNEVYLKNNAYSSARYNKAVKAVKFLDEYLWKPLD